MATALPPSVDFTANTVTEAQLKQALTNLRDYLSGLLGTTGLPADARTSLNVQPLSTQLTTFSELVSYANGLPYFSSPNVMAQTTITTPGRDVLACVSYAAILDLLNGAAKGLNTDITGFTNQVTVPGLAATDTQLIPKQQLDTAIATRATTPTNTIGIGQFVTVVSADALSLLYLPTGGTWAYSVVYHSLQDNSMQYSAGVAAGGQSFGTDGYGFAWRIA